MATGSTAVRAALKRVILSGVGSVIERLPMGKRTAWELVAAMKPARLSLVLAGMAFVLAFSLYPIAWGLKMSGLGLIWLSGKITQYATTFEAMPLWLLIGAVMSQVAGRAMQAWDDAWKHFHDGGME